MKRASCAFLLIAFLGYFYPADATLIERGEGLIYDDATNITWTKDAGLVFTSGYFEGGYSLNWHEAMEWAEQLEFAGFTGWRLPTADVVTDYHPFESMVGTEMGHVYWELGINQNIFNSGPFINITQGSYWLSTESWGPSSGSYAKIFSFTQDESVGGDIRDTYKDNSIGLAWAVHDGDIGLTPVPVPEPSTLLISGLMLFFCFNQYRKRMKII